MRLPVVAIVGRPNVGKSSLFNRLARRRISIVDPVSGVTRDRVATEIHYKDRHFELVDTGGIGLVDDEELARQVSRQIERAVQEAELLVFVVDVREGITPADETSAALLRPHAKQLLLVANKADHPKLELAAAEFHKLGLGTPLVAAARSGTGTRKLLEEIVRHLERTPSAPAHTAGLKLAIVGKRNVGKSTLINQLVGEERVITNEIPGTTRDAIDVRLERGKKTYLLIDTPGFRKKGKVRSSVEFYSLARAQRSVRRADVAILMLDARAKVSGVDKSLAGYIVGQLKPCIIAINKCDLLDDLSTPAYGKYISQELPGLYFAPITFISSKTGMNVTSLFDLADDLYGQASRRITTGKLNQVLKKAMERRSPPRKGRRQPKVYYATQVNVAPITIVLFANYPRLFSAQYKRFLANYFREHLNLPEVPIKIELRPRRPELEATTSR